jgi:pimeloyl-ACP methyl ester carboxylesterase
LAALRLDSKPYGRPIILLHGLAQSLGVWRADPVFPKLGPCIALSLPGHFPAAFPPGFRAEDLTAELIADLLGAAIRQLVGERQPVLVAGFSTGGFAALALAAAQPALVAQAVSIAGFAQGRWRGALGRCQWLARHGALASAILKWTMKSLARPSLYPAIWRQACADPRAFDAYPDRQAFLETSRADYQQLDWAAMTLYYRAMADMDISDRLPRIAAQTLILTGDRDPYIPFAQPQLLAQQIPHAELAVISGAGHLLFAERPEEYRQKLEGWLWWNS